MRSPRILLVEDDAGVREHLLERLSRYEVIAATCQQEAIEQLLSTTFNAVLLDLRLPRRAGDMKTDIEVGMDTLKEITRRGLTQRSSKRALPVIIMTAYGSEDLPAELLQANAAYDYISKPFGQERLLERKLERALAYRGALAPVGSIPTRSVRVAFSPCKQKVRVESVVYSGAFATLLGVLGEAFISDQRELRPPDDYRCLTAKELAEELSTSDQAIRRRISNFRKQAREDLHAQLGWQVEGGDVIENLRDWKGYRLNPAIVRVLQWHDLQREYEEPTKRA